jgi:uncharacterized protein (DUF427 family)
MVKAIWNGKVVAEADHTEMVEGNHYFPAESVRREFFQQSDTHSICPWKARRTITPCSSMAKGTPMPPGTIPNQS